MTVTLINSFTVPPEHEEGFLRTWRAPIGHFATAPGLRRAGCTATPA
ncbi:antibiotic biosynthesis monooxygenase family protein [Amycolatopsis sp. CA-126428]|nr:hypothetical protein [Amycolatopsis sp. CA-126428]